MAGPGPRRSGARVPVLLVMLIAMLMSFGRRVEANDVMTHYGGSVIAMRGKGCVGIACDMRLGAGPQTVSTDARRVFKVNDGAVVAFTGLFGIAQQVMAVLGDQERKAALQRLKEPGMTPMAVYNFLSRFLWENRGLPCEVVVAGVDKGEDGKVRTHLCGMDGLGAKVLNDDFVVAGTASQSLYGVCEASYTDGMGPEELLETLEKCMRNAMDRDCLSGGDTVVHIVTEKGVTSKRFKGRVD